MIVIVGMNVLLGACASRGSVRDVGTRVEQVAKDLAELRKAHDVTIRDTSVLTMELRTLNGRLRDTDVRLRETGDRVAALGNRIAAAETSLRELVTAVEALPRPAPAPAASAGLARPVASEGSVAAEQAFAGALKTFRGGEHGQAVLELTEFLVKFPGHPLTARAQLWIGEAYYRQRDFRQALLEFRKAVDAAPDAVAAADGWLKIGQTYAALKERPAANAAFQRVVREYPESEAAGRARSLIKK